MDWNDIISSKIYTDRDKLKADVETWKGFNDVVVFTNGCFDILHLGHIDYLTKAAELGDRMVVALNTDASVSALKGSNRPVIDEATRIMKMASFAFVDAVVLFGEDTPAELIELLTPDVLVKGGDYTLDTIVGADTVLNNGGQVEVIPFLEGHSTSNIINKILGN